MNEKLADLINISTDCFKQLYDEQTVRNKERRKHEQAKRQAQIECQNRTCYQLPYTVQLSNEQFEQVQMYGAVTLYIQQSSDIVCHYIRQAVMKGDTATLKSIQQETYTDLSSNFDIVRSIHFSLYDSFIRAYYPSLTYAEVTPSGYIFLMSSQGHGFTYTLNLETKMAQAKIKEDFESFKNTQICKKLFVQWHIKKAKISYNSSNHSLFLILN